MLRPPEDLSDGVIGVIDVLIRHDVRGVLNTGLSSEIPEANRKTDGVEAIAAHSNKILWCHQPA